MAKRFYDETTSRACQDDFWHGRDLDLEMKKPHPRLISAARRKGIGPAIIDNMKKRRIPDGLYWAAEQGILDRTLEALVLRHEDDFPEEIREIASRRLDLMKAQTTPPAT
jgi:hypothetical protein